MLNIVSAPNPILSQKAKPIFLVANNKVEKITKLDKPVSKLIEEMKQILADAKDPEGVGLAAPQVGKSLQIFIIKPTAKSVFQTFINPQLLLLKNEIAPEKTEAEKEKRKKLEGCLSLKNVWGEVARSDKVFISYFDETGKYHQKKFVGFPSIIIQHEYDHLNGILFPKRVLEQKGKLYKSHKSKKGEDEFEEIKL